MGDFFKIRNLPMGGNWNPLHEPPHSHQQNFAAAQQLPQAGQPNNLGAPQQCPPDGHRNHGNPLPNGAANPVAQQGAPAGLGP